MHIRTVTLARPSLLGLYLLCLFGCAHVVAQEAAPQTLTLAQAVELAQKNYPSIRAARAQKQAAEAGVELARTSYLPRADLLVQENRATRNNLFGLLLPQSTLPSISGPQLDDVTLQSAWGSAAGLLFSWEPFDFGLRRANVELARAVVGQAAAQEAVTQLDVTSAAADAYLTLLANTQAVKAAAANVARAETLTGTIRVLVENQLRPGVDQSRADAELAAAKNQLILTEQNAALARITLAEAIGQADAIIHIDDQRLLELPLVAPPAALNFSLTPVALAQTAAITTVKARQQILDRSYFPRFNWQTAVYGRGSGAFLDGRFDNSRGFYPDTFNWGTGLTVTFSVTDIFGVRARRRAEQNNLAAEQARYDQVVNTLKAQDARARTLIDTARRIAANTPVQLRAAQETLQRAKVRYDYGLANVTEVADAQRLLAQAEIDDAVARLGIWRALLVAAKLQGDLTSFLQQAANNK